RTSPRPTRPTQPGKPLRVKPVEARDSVLRTRRLLFEPLPSILDPQSSSTQPARRRRVSARMRAGPAAPAVPSPSRTLPAASLPSDDPAHGDGRDPAGAQAPRDLSAQQVGQRVTHNAVQDAAGFLGADPVHVDFTGVRQGGLYRGLGDLVERDAEGTVLVELQF